MKLMTLFILSSFLMPMTASAVYKGFRNYTLRCGSEGFSPNQCEFRKKSFGAVKKNTISGSSCDYGKTWGYSGYYAWVHSGCELDMLVFEDVPGDSYQHVLCMSSNYQVAKCVIRHSFKEIELVTQLSKSNCMEGVSWGYDWDDWVEANILWVSDGCKGVFRTSLEVVEPPVSDDDAVEDGDDPFETSDDEIVIIDIE